MFIWYVLFPYLYRITYIKVHSFNIWLLIVKKYIKKNYENLIKSRIKRNYSQSFQ